MNLIMAGIDYKTAQISVREKFSLSSSKIEQVLTTIRTYSFVKGCVLLSTCNRTELYISLNDEMEICPTKVLCEQLAIDCNDYDKYFIVRKNHNLIRHLLMVTSGLRSQLRGDDQILTQVTHAVTFARNLQMVDPVLETLFRNAITSGKKVKTNVPVFSVERSVAKLGVETLKAQLGNLSGKKALVIGNGAMGQLSANLLIQAGCKVTITLRSYKRGKTIVPIGCDTIEYDKRYQRLAQCGILVSATASTHYTITKELLEQCERIPQFIVDLAVPQDIEPKIADISGVTCWNVDSLSQPQDRVDIDKIRMIQTIVNEYETKFYHWIAYRENLKINKEVQFENIYCGNRSRK